MESKINNSEKEFDLNELNEQLHKIDIELVEFQNLTEEQKLKKIIKNQLELKKDKFLHEKEYYREKIFNSWKPGFIDELDIDIELCTTTEQRDLWNYFKIMTSSANGSDKTIKEFKILVKDKKTNKYLGIINLSPELKSYSDRDKFIGWKYENKDERITLDNGKTQPRISFLVNIQCCVGLQPVAFNTNLGKLLVAIVFSKEVLELYKEKYGYYYAGVSTMSLYGKSIQYDRLKEIKLIGFTKGFTMTNIPMQLLNKIIEFSKKYFVINNNNKIINKIRYFNKFLNKYYPNDNYFKNNQQRGIYFGYTGTGNELFFKGEKNSFQLDKTKNLKDIIEWWKNRWAKQRFEHLLNENKIKIALELKDFTTEEKKKEYDKQYSYTKYHLNEEEKLKYLENKRIEYNEKKEKNRIPKRTVSFDEIVEILLWKKRKINNEKFTDNKEITQTKISKLLSEKYLKNISDTIVKKYWNGECKLNEFEFVENINLNYNEYLEIIKFKFN